MWPVIISIGGFHLSSFGLFLVLGLFASIFTLWRLGKFYELNEENLTSISLFTFISGLISARLVAVLLHLSSFDSFDKIFLITKYPGMSFWGGIVGSLLAILLLYKRYKFNLWLLLDLVAVAFLIGLFFGEIGCFLGGCNVGIESKFFLAFPVVGMIGRHLALPLIEAAYIIILFKTSWKKVIRFHNLGSVFAKIIISLGLLKLVTEFYRDERLIIPQNTSLSLGLYLSLLTFILGTYLYYLTNKRNLIEDLKAFWQVMIRAKKRELLLQRARKNWYNYRVSLSFRFKKSYGRLTRQPKNHYKRLTKLKRTFNVKPTPENFN